MKRTHLNYLLAGGAVLVLLIAGAFYTKENYIEPEAPPVIVNTQHGPVEIIDEKIKAGDLLSSPDLGTIYYLNSDLERVVFPDEQTYLSWYANFDDINFVSREKLESFPLSGRNATIRPGTFLVTIQSSPQVWFISYPSALHWLAGGEEQVISYFSQNWQDRLVDVPEYYIANYKQGIDIEDKITYPAGMFLHAKSNDAYYMITESGQRQVTKEGVEANRFQMRFVIEIDKPLGLTLSGPPIKDTEARWSSPDTKEQAADLGPKDIDIQGAEGQVG